MGWIALLTALVLTALIIVVLLRALAICASTPN